MRMLCIEINENLWQFIDMMASDRSAHKGYTIDEMIDNKPQKEQILKWLQEIQSGKMQYKKKYKN